MLPFLKKKTKHFITIHPTDGLYWVMGRVTELFQNKLNLWEEKTKKLPNTKLWEILVLVLIQGCISKARAALQI